MASPRSSVHGIAVDPTTRRVFVNDRNNGRVQVFDEDGNYLDEWDFFTGLRGQALAKHLVARGAAGAGP